MIGSLQNEAYTGANRCNACTAVNLAITVVLSGAVVAAGSHLAGMTVAVGTGATTFALGTVSIWLRGYLVPGTPELTKRYMPSWMLTWFGKNPSGLTGDAGQADAYGPGQDFDIGTQLGTVGAVGPCQDEDDLCLQNSFEKSWRAALEDVTTEPVAADGLAVMGFEPEEVTIERFGEAMVVRRFGSDLLKWPSETALRVDLASAAALADRSDEWETYSPAERAQLLQGLRVFLTECPGGDETVLEGDSVTSCCDSYEVATVVCSESGDRVFEQPIR